MILKMEALINPVKDVIKYNVIRYINTGDRTYDSLLQTMIVAVMTLFFTKSFWMRFLGQFGFYIKSWLPSQHISGMSSMTYPYYAKQAKKRSFIYVSPHEDDEYIQIMTSLVRYITDLTFLPGKRAVCVYNFEEKKIVKAVNKHQNNPTVILRDLIDDQSIIPMMVQNGELIVLHRDGNCFFIGYEEISHLDKFYQILLRYGIEKQKLVSTKSEGRPREIVNYPGKKSGTIIIYPDRTFDLIVSRHKSDIISMLDKFVSSNQKQMSDLNGFGTYNLGFMLYGAPGTGKTSLAKAIANYLKRNIVMVDMRKIKSQSDIDKLFVSYDVNKYVFYLDEIDCVPGILSRYHEQDEKEGMTGYDKVQESRKQLLEKISQATSAEAVQTLKEELEKANKNLDELKTHLTLDTLLTTLDGIMEMRGRVIIASTNMLNKLDPALIRPGRFDFAVELTVFNRDEIIELLTKAYDGTLSKKEYKAMHSAKYCEIYTPAEIIRFCQQKRSITKVIERLCKNMK